MIEEDLDEVARLEEEEKRDIKKIKCGDLQSIRSLTEKGHSLEYIMSGLLASGQFDVLEEILNPNSLPFVDERGVEISCMGIPCKAVFEYIKDCFRDGYLDYREVMFLLDECHFYDGSNEFVKRIEHRQKAEISQQVFDFFLKEYTINASYYDAKLVETRLRELRERFGGKRNDE